MDKTDCFMNRTLNKSLKCSIIETDLFYLILETILK